MLLATPVRNLACAALLVALAPAGAAAQHPGIARDPTLDERLEAAERVAWVEVESSSPGRLQLRLHRALQGALPERFEVKRAPSTPPPLATGSHAILLLRGARPPYVFAEDPRRVLEVAPDRAAALADAIEAAASVRTDARRLAAVYQSWIPSDDPRLRAMGAAGLEGLLEGHESMRREVSLAQAEVAVDPQVGLEGRRAAALLAVRHLDGAARLVRGLAAGEAIDDPSLMRLGLQAGASVGAPEVGELYAAAVAHPDPQMRRTAMRLARAVSQVVGKGALEAAARLAKDDPESSVRRQAERALRSPARGASGPLEGS